MSKKPRTVSPKGEANEVSLKNPSRDVGNKYAFAANTRVK